MVKINNKGFALISKIIIVSVISISSGHTKPPNDGTTGSGMTKPNILWLVAEDLSPMIPAFGDSTISTPNLDRLAREGVRYTGVYSVSGVCSPSRAALATGMYPSRIGAHNMQIGNVPREMMNNPMALQFIKQYMPSDLEPYEVVPPPVAKLHSEYLRKVGYYCSNNAKEDYQFKPSPFSWDESSSSAHWRNRAENQPFFSVFNFMVTHESRIWNKSNDSLWVDSQIDVHIPPYLPSTEISKNDIRRAYSNILEMDHKVGILLNELEEDGELENTIIFWYSDHGGPLPRQKRLLYDSGLSVPMIIRFPNNLNAGSVDNQLISFVDFLPTLLSLVNIQPPDYLDGQAFLGMYAAKTERKYVHAAADRFDEHRDMIRAVRNNRFKYIKNFIPDQGYYLPLSFREQMPIMKELLRMRDQDKLNEIQSLWFRDFKPKEELFDCENDPHELVNLADNSDFEDILKELRNECLRWMNEIEDKGFVREDELAESFWPDGIQPISQRPYFIQEGTSIRIKTDETGSMIGYQIIAKEGAISDTWKIYQQEIQLEQGEILVAIAHRKGYLQSETIFVHP